VANQNGSTARVTPPADRESLDGESAGLPPVDDGLLPFMRGPLSPLVDALAKAKVSVRTKLLTGFLVVALLLLDMAIIGGVFINGMSRQVDEITLIQEKTNHVNNL